MDHDPNSNFPNVRPNNHFPNVRPNNPFPNVRPDNPYPNWSESQNWPTNFETNSSHERGNTHPNYPYPNWPVTPNTPINPMSGPGAPHFQGYHPYGYYPPYGFPPQGYPTQASNSSKRNSSDGTGTDKDEGTPSSEKSSYFQQQFSPQGLDSIKLTFEEDVDDHEVNHARHKKVSYSSAENELVAKCWIDISIDSIVGNDQKLDQMWMRIAELYNKNRPAGKSERQWGNLKSHFYTLQKQTRWFCECYDKIAKEWGSGKSDSDIIEMAQEEYKKRHNKFGYKHIGVWRLLRECPKFASVDGDVHSKKKMKTSESGAYTSSSANEEDAADQSRPIGQKAAKRNAKGKGKSIDVELIKEAKESIDAKNEKVSSYIEIEEYKILMKDEEEIKPEKRAIHKKMLDKIKKKWGL